MSIRTLSQARWPESEADSPAALPQIPGFIVSSFNPLVAVVADRCLARRPGPPPDRTAILLASASGDLATAHALADAVRTGRRVQPLLFFQSNPNAVLGHIAARHRLTGPVVCLGPLPGPPGEPAGRALAGAELLLLDGDADEVLVITAEQGDEPAGDAARAVLVDLKPQERGI